MTMVLGQTDSSNAERFENPNSKLQYSISPSPAKDNPCSSDREQADSPKERWIHSPIFVISALFAVN
ncbi:MAG: hypothetical protein ACJASX_002927 [Limisphaerales bacterium]|jgi:hypothetical protein